MSRQRANGKSILICEWQPVFGVPNTFIPKEKRRSSSSSFHFPIYFFVCWQEQPVLQKGPVKRCGWRAEMELSWVDTSSSHLSLEKTVSTFFSDRPLPKLFTTVKSIDITNLKVFFSSPRKLTLSAHVDPLTFVPSPSEIVLGQHFAR